MAFLWPFFDCVPHERIRLISAVCIKASIDVKLFEKVPNEIETKCSVGGAYLFCCHFVVPPDKFQVG